MNPARVDPVRRSQQRDCRTRVVDHLGVDRHRVAQLIAPVAPGERAFVVAQDGDAALGQSPGQIAERFDHIDG